MADASQPARKRAKRQRDSGRRTTATIEYPKIPNVPMDVIPGFVEAIRASAKVLQHHGRRVFLDHETEYRKLGNSCGTNDDRTSPQPSRNSASIHAQLMNRVQNAADTDRTNKEQAQFARLEKQRLAIEAWIDSVKRFANRKSSNDTQATNEQHPQNNNDRQQQQQQQQENKKERPSVPYACFLYLWDLQQETPTKLHVRRAALYLSGMLLSKSKDCRFHLQMESNLADWIVKITTIPKHQQDRESIFLALLQHEALWLLEKLQEQGYGTLYPKIAVAATRLRQQCPPLVTASDNDDDGIVENHPTNGTNEATNASIRSTILHRNMVDWRIIRDLALKYGNKELSRLQKRIAKCQESLEILVPRMGQEFDHLPAVDKKDTLATDTPTIEQPPNTVASAEPNDDDEDEDDIDWEDGDEELEEKEQELLASHHHHPVHHLLAVDRTLAAMKSVAGGLRGGELEIDMRKSEKEQEEEGMVSQATDSLEAERKIEAKTRFDKLVKILREKHLPRLSLWLDGLANADNLVKSNGAALVLLPASSIQQRQKLIRELTGAKKSISSILSSAVRLEEKEKANLAESTEGTEENNAEGNDEENNQLPFMFGAVPRPSDASSTRRIQSMLVSRGEGQGRAALASAIARHQRRKKAHARSSRIQIKVKSR